MDVIRFEGVGKRYEVGGREASYLTIREALRGLLRRSHKERFWAVRDLDLTVTAGEVVGIIGRNGSGKSTTLKLVTRITAPTVGRVRTRGRVGSLLEVGTGFHPELTGRENVYLSASVLGLTRAETRAKFDEIVEFAGVERFLDTPLKRYSSGMHLRLAFAVAAHAEPPLLAVDEVLAVGDAEFQRKCLGKMSELGDSDRTVLFVSHDTGAVASLCSRVIWLDGGRVVADGDPGDVVSGYLESTAGSGAPLAAHVSVDEDAPVSLRRVAVETEDGTEATGLTRGQRLAVRLDLHVRELVHGLDVALVLRDGRGTTVIDDRFSDHREVAEMPLGRHDVSAAVPGILPSGRYVLTVWVGTETDDFFYDDVLEFEIQPASTDRREQVERTRAVQPEIVWRHTGIRDNARSARID